jgi:tetratricopeptide (TPR) repeat protein
MKLKKQLQLALLIPSYCVMLGIPAAIFSINSQVDASPVKLARLSDSEKAERAGLIQKANSLVNDRNLPGAEQTLRELVKKFPNDAFAHYQLGYVLYQQEKAEDAATSLSEAIRLNPRYALAHNAMGLIRASQERWDDAIAEFRKALEINPQYGDALMYMGQVLLETNKKEEAIASLDKALNIFKAEKRNERINRIEKILQTIKKSDDPSVS